MKNPFNSSMKKPMIIMLSSVIILGVIVVSMKALKTHIITKKLDAFKSPIVTVSAAPVGYSQWQPQYQASATTRAIQGVNVTAEVGGMVRTIYFTPGAMATKGQLLVQLNIDPQTAQLKSLEATAHLDKITYNRDKAQYAIKAISKATLDTDEANWQSATAAVNQQLAVIAQSTIRAPFSGRLGVCQINPGQYLSPGNTVTSLQTLDPMYADFYVPQSVLPQLKTGQLVSLSSDSLSKEVFKGTITTIDSSLNSSSLNTEIEATVANPDHTLIPGMFANITVETGLSQKYLTLPQAAVSFNSYGAIVYLLKLSAEKDPVTGKDLYIAAQTFITTGETRGDQITIVKGLKAGDLVVTSGQVKLKNNSKAIINNSVLPPDTATASPAEKTDH